MQAGRSTSGRNRGHSPLIDEIHDKDGRRIKALEARTLCEAFQLTASERPGQVAHRTLDGSVEFTFGEYAERVQALATGLHSLGVRRGDTVALMLVNRPEFALADAAAMHLGAIAFSVYNTLAPEQINYLLQKFAVSRRRDGTHVPAAGPGRAYARGRAHRAGGRRGGRHDHAGGPRPTTVQRFSLRGCLARLPTRRRADAHLHVRHDGTAESRATDACRRDVHGAGICECNARHRRWTRHFIPAAGARRRSGHGLLRGLDVLRNHRHLDSGSPADRCGARVRAADGIRRRAPCMGKDQERAGGGGTQRSGRAAGHGQGGGQGQDRAGPGALVHQRRGAGVTRSAAVLCRSRHAGQRRLGNVGSFRPRRRSIRCRTSASAPSVARCQAWK